MIFVILGIVILFMWSYNFRLTTTRYEIISPKIPISFHGKKIILLSDLHGNSFGKDNNRLIREIEKSKPDYIMISGDMLVDSGKGFYTSLNLLRKLVKHYPVYYSPGNHELKLKENDRTKRAYEKYVKLIKEMGVSYLTNESDILVSGKEVIPVTGLDLERNYYAKYWKNVDIKESHLVHLIGNAKREKFNLLLAHNPDFFESYAKWGADLVLSGHIHGGIAILPFLGGVISPSYRLFPKYDYGKFVIGTSSLILSKGLGLHKIKLRLFNIPEVILIDLKSKRD